MTNKRGKESPENSPTGDAKKRKKANQPKIPGDIAHSSVAQQVESNLGVHDISSSNDSEINRSCNDDEDRYVATALKPLLPHEGRNAATILKPLMPNEEMVVLSIYSPSKC